MVISPGKDVKVVKVVEVVKTVDIRQIVEWSNGESEKRIQKTQYSIHWKNGRME
jgi:hypothetical protein